GAVWGWRAGGHRSRGRAGGGLLRHHCLIDWVYQGWQAARARGHHGRSLGGAFGHPDRGRILAWLRGEFLVQRWSTEGHAGRDRREAQHGDQYWPCRAQDEGAAGRPRWRRARALARRIWETDRRRNREMEQGNQGCQHQAGMTRQFRSDIPNARSANPSTQRVSALGLWSC